MDDLRRMVIYYNVVNTHSFSGAARQPGIAKSAISRHVSLVEKSSCKNPMNRMAVQNNLYSGKRAFSTSYTYYY